MAMLKAVIGILAVVALVAGGYYIYSNFLEGGVQKFSITNYNPGVQERLIDVKGEVTQFYKNMRFNHDRISYYINTECSSDKISKMKEAFGILSAKTNSLISFYADSEAEAEILVGCSADSYEKEENIFIAGEGGPTRIVNSSMPVITRGKVLLYSDSRSDCTTPNLELHELIHVFGYDHVNNSKDIMYPYLSCGQEISEDLIKHMIKLYAIAPFAELSFANATASKETYMGKEYLHFNISIDNNGLIDAKKVMLDVYAGADGKLAQSFDLDIIKFGAGQNFYVKNLLLPDNTQEIEFKVNTTIKEQSYSNNNLKLKI